MQSPDYRPMADVLALHASAVLTPGGALMFLGHGGTGKSTICELLSSHYSRMADDAVFLFRNAKGCWLLADGSRRAFLETPPAGELAGIPNAPLLALFRLFQRDEGFVSPISSQATCHHLTDALFEIPRQQRECMAIKRAFFASLAGIARQHPGAELYFALDSEGTFRVVGKFIEMTMQSPPFTCEGQ